MWRGHEVPPPSAFGLPPRTPLNKMLEHFSDAVRVVRFADGRPDVTKKYFWPHELGEHLWDQQPDSVTVYRADGATMIYRIGSASAVAE